jgi:hypothetical protein
MVCSCSVSRILSEPGQGAVLLIAVAFDVYQKSRKAKETVAKVAEL